MLKLFLLITLLLFANYSLASEEDGDACSITRHWKYDGDDTQHWCNYRDPETTKGVIKKEGWRPYCHIKYGGRNERLGCDNKCTKSLLYTTDADPKTRAFTESGHGWWAWHRLFTANC